MRISDWSSDVCSSDLQAPSIEGLRERLLAIRGIGPWTVNYTLLRGYGWLDGSLHGDVAVRHGIEALLSTPDKLNDKQAQAWLEEFSPWRALDRKRVVSGKSVSVLVDLGGRRIIKKKTNNNSKDTHNSQTL